MNIRALPVFFVLLLVGGNGAKAQGGMTAQSLDEIRREAETHSQIMHTVHLLSDLYGPRLTGSPNEKAAAEWAEKQMLSWGMENVHLEPWLFGHSGWTNEHASGYVVAPIRDQLYFKVAAWTPSTHGDLIADAVLIAPPEVSTQEQLTSYLTSVAAKVAGKIVMIGAGGPVPVNLDPIMHRLDKRYIEDLLNPNGSWSKSQPDADSTVLRSADWNRRIDKFLMEHGALMRVDDAHRPYGEIRWAYNVTYDLTQALPTVVLRNEDYGRIARLLADGMSVRLLFNIQNASNASGKVAYNTIAEIPGTDRRDEVVMLGAHLDSWHTATGATDDAVGCAIMMEAARILLALDIHPRRTVRVALWTGEEQGLFGSQTYVAEHFGTAENPKPDFEKLDVYVNIDSGTGRVRMANIFGPADDASILRKALAPLADLGVEGAVEHRIRRLRSTDATTFSRAGLPAIGLTQDPIDYESATWHSNLDTFNQVIEPEAEQAAIVVASLVYELSMRDEMLPRFPRDAMPPAYGPPPMDRPIVLVRSSKEQKSSRN